MNAWAGLVSLNQGGDIMGNLSFLAVLFGLALFIFVILPSLTI